MGAGKGRQRRTRAAAAVSDREQKHQPVAGDHPLFDQERSLGGATLHSEEIAGEHICYLAHRLVLTEGEGYPGRFRSFICTISSIDQLADPYMTTPMDREESQNYLITVQNLISGFKSIAHSAKQKRNAVVVVPAGDNPSGTARHVALAYAPPARRQKPTVVMLNARDHDGVVTADYETDAKERQKTSRFFGLGEFSPDTLQGGAQLLEQIQEVEKEYEEAQERRRESVYGASAKALVPDLEAAT